MNPDLDVMSHSKVTFSEICAVSCPWKSFLFVEGKCLCLLCQDHEAPGVVHPVPHQDVRSPRLHALLRPGHEGNCGGRGTHEGGGTVEGQSVATEECSCIPASQQLHGKVTSCIFCHLNLQGRRNTTADSDNYLPSSLMVLHHHLSTAEVHAYSLLDSILHCFPIFSIFSSFLHLGIMPDKLRTSDN